MGKRKKRRREYVSERNARLRAQYQMEKRDMLIGGIGFVILIVAGIFLLNQPSGAFEIYLSAVVIGIILCLDHSGLRRLLMHFYPDKAPFAAFLKRSDEHRSRLMEAAATVCYLSMLLTVRLPGLVRVWTLIYSVCIVIGFCYIVRGGVYAWDRHAEGSLTTLFLLFAGLFGMSALTAVNYLAYSRLLWMTAVPAVIVGVLYLLFAHSDEPIAGGILTLIAAAMCVSGILGMVNLQYDKGATASYTVAVTDKDYSHHYRGGSTYYLITEPVPDMEDEKFEVSPSLYGDTEIGDTVRVRIFAGALGIPYCICSSDTNFSSSY